MNVSRNNVTFKKTLPTQKTIDRHHEQTLTLTPDKLSLGDDALKNAKNIGKELKKSGVKYHHLVTW